MFSIDEVDILVQYIEYLWDMYRLFEVIKSENYLEDIKNRNISYGKKWKILYKLLYIITAAF